MQSYTTQQKQLYVTLGGGDHMNKVHTCGDVLQGQVHLNVGAGAPIHLESFQVNFKCKVKTYITARSNASSNNRRTYKCKVYLFHYATVFLQQATTFTGTQTFPFSFQLPYTTQPHPSQSILRAHPNFEGGPGQPLPPTFSTQNEGHIQTITYYLEPVAMRSGKLMSHKMKDKLPILFIPPRFEPSPPIPLVSYSEKFQRTSRLLDPKKRDEPWGLKEKTKHFFTSHDSDPTAVFSMRGRVPNAGIVDQPLPAGLDMEFDNSNSTAPEQPPLTLVSIHARLTAYTEYRVAFTSLMLGDRGFMKQGMVKIDIVKQAFDPPIPVHDGMDLSQLVPQFGLSSGIPPTFKSPTISRWYMIKLTAEVSCADKKSEVLLGKQGFVAHSAVWNGPLAVPPPQAKVMGHYGVQGSAGGQAGPSTVATGSGEGDLPPPSYGEVVGAEGSNKVKEEMVDAKR